MCLGTACMQTFDRLSALTINPFDREQFKALKKAAPSVCLDLVRDVLRILLTNPGGNGKELIIDVFRRLRDSNRCAVYDIDDEEDLELRLEKYPEVFRFHGRGRDIAVSPNINLSICPTHSYKVGSCKEQTCAALHLCMFFLLSGKCAFKDRCLFGHDLNTDHNRRRLQDHLLGGLNMTELRTLFCLPWVRRGVTVPRVCRYYNQQVGCAKGQSCRSLHMCRMYVLQRCKFGKGCARNHDVNHPLVKDVLTLYGVNVTGRPLKDILDEVRTYERPDTGADSEDADDKEATSGVAVGAGARPQRFASTPNLFQTGKLSLTPQAEGSSQRCPSASRRQRNCSESSYGALSRDGGAKQKMEELCRFQFTETGCRFGERCRCLHGSDPFLWRFTVWDENEAGQEVTWRSLDPTNNLHLERDYCQPHVIESTVTDIDGTKMKVDLKHFTAVNSGDKMRYRAVRLSTPSSMETSTRSSDGHHSTVWLWYWRGRNGQWNEFGLEREGFERLPLRSNTVERNFLASHNTPLNIGHFVLDFNKMRLKDLATHNKFKVRRRPQFQLRNNESEPEDGGMSMRTRENQQNRGSQLRHHGLYDGPHCMTPPRGPPPFQWHYSAGPPMPPFPYPFPWHFNPYNPWPPHHSYVQQPRSQSHQASLDGEWAVMPAPDDVQTTSDDEEGKLDVAAPPPVADDAVTLLRPSNKQYEKIRRPFCGTVGKAVHIVSIHKVKNHLLEKAYDRKKKSMARASGGQSVSEGTLYYGPERAEDIHSICHNGIDCGNVGAIAKNDNPLGKGGYFHVNAAQADKSSKRAKVRRVFVVQCLVGRWGQGSPELRSPPAVDPERPSGQLFDSCADDPRHPKTFVIFDKAQVCPKYLITYQFA